MRCKTVGAGRCGSEAAGGFVSGGAVKKKKRTGPAVGIRARGKQKIARARGGEGDGEKQRRGESW